MKKNLNYLIVFIAIIFTILTCNNPTPKPRAYFRIKFPEKKYQVYDSTCPFKFEYPIYMKIRYVENYDNEPCWINIEFPEFKCTIHLTYKNIKNNFNIYTEDIRSLVYKHTIKADDIIENFIKYPEKNVYGISYEIKGNTATSLIFYLTDSTKNFIAASLYFSSQPNIDSIGPVLVFIKKDIDHLIETFYWKQK